VDLDETPCVLVFQWDMYIHLTPWPNGQALVLQVFLDQVTGPSFHTFTVVHVGTYLFRASLGHLTKFSQIGIVTDTEIHMVLDIPQGDPVPLSHHC